MVARKRTPLMGSWRDTRSNQPRLSMPFCPAQRYGLSRYQAIAVKFPTLIHLVFPLVRIPDVELAALTRRSDPVSVHAEVHLRHLSTSFRRELNTTVRYTLETYRRSYGTTEHLAQPIT